MSDKFEMQDKDFRGLHLCRPCWQGHDNHKNCLHGDCECPCQKMEQNRRDDLSTQALIRAENKKKQINGLSVWPMEQIGPAKSRDEG